MPLGGSLEHPGAIPIDGWSELTEEYSELARFWVSGTRAFTLVAPDICKSPALLGSLLVECVHTAAEGYAAGGRMSKSQALSELWSGFDEERARLDQEQTAEDQD